MAEILIHIPDWIDEVVDRERRYLTVEERVGVAIELARENVERELGGPFGAAVFETESGRLVAAGVNRVTAEKNSVLHAEMVALMRAHAALGSYALGGEDRPAHDLATSCDPCAMCLGATLWSGVRRLLGAARREDAMALGFDEGPVFDESFDYLRDRGVEIVRGVRRDEARRVMEEYFDRGGAAYNG